MIVFSMLHGTVATAAMAATAVCTCVAASQAKPNSQKSSRDPASLWLLAAGVMLVTFDVDAYHLDLNFVLWMRAVAQSQGWYNMRRPLQTLVLVLLVGGAVCAAQLPKHAGFARSRPVLAHWNKIVCYGLVLSTALLLLRFVSFHYTDKLLNYRIIYISFGRLLEVASLSLVLIGSAYHCLRKAKTDV